MKTTESTMRRLLRPLPTETVQGLTPPLPGFPYLAHADEFRFQPFPAQRDAGECSPINAWWLADASFLVYGDADFIERTIASTPLPELGFQVTWIGTREHNRGMVLANEEAMIVVFRGTRIHQHSLLDAAEVVMIDQNDLLTDSNFLPTACQVGGEVHQGFLAGYSEISDSLDSIISGRRESQSLWFTGHSLGGALAAVAATHFSDHSIQGVYTYGAPRVGNAEFAKVLPRGLQQRFVHREDWVPTLPPEMIGYRHGGTLQQVVGSGARNFFADMTTGTRSFVTAAMSMATELKIDLGKLPMKINGLADHAPIYYATLLWNSLIESAEESSAS